MQPTTRPLGEAAASVPTPPKGRFAPSPTAPLHAGNIYASLCAWLLVKQQGGSMVLRIEDLDRQRSKPAFADALMRDYEALGLFWDEGPYYQQTRTEAYAAAFEALRGYGHVYPCFCSRADLHAASAPHAGEQLVYAGTCRALTLQQVEIAKQAKQPAYRIEVPSEQVGFTDGLQGAFQENLAEACGDFLIKRSDGTFAYQLAVVADDAEQGITSVTRGADLLASTPQQLFLQRLLGLPQPTYAHVPLMVNQQGRRLSKREGDASLEQLLATYGTPQGVIGHMSYLAGLQPADEPCTPQDLLACATFDALRGKRQLTWQ